ncbi:glycosyltransferase [Eubacteriales bacterium OttesenSCG-928-A19]|nr:glycosyltransferase [Eubacteriales bacterium OttesenSCG-928-A19]
MARIMMVNTVCTGSHGRIMCDLRTAAEKKGHEVRIAYGRGADCGGQTIRIGSRRDVLAHVALTRLLDKHARGSKGATRAFIRQLDAFSPELLHLHNVHGYYLHAETLFSYIREHALPTLWTHHDCWAVTGHCSHFVRANCDRWRSECHDCPLKRAYPASYGLDASRENWQWKRAAFSGLPSLRIVSPSQWLDGVMADSMLRDTPRQVIGNGVDLSLFVPTSDASVRSRLGIDPNVPLLLAVASPFDERKGFSDALRLAESLSGKAHVCLVGLTDKQMKRLPGYVTGITRTDGPEALVALYGAADCLINPTYEDTYPTVNMEALACGTPVACYGVGGATEQLREPVGVAVRVGDVSALAKAAMRLAKQKRLLSPICRERAEQMFDRRKAIEAYMGIYQELTGA